MDDDTCTFPLVLDYEMKSLNHVESNCSALERDCLVVTRSRHTIPRPRFD